MIKLVNGIYKEMDDNDISELEKYYDNSSEQDKTTEDRVSDIEELLSVLINNFILNKE